jgi:hypothetical protein
VGQAVQLHVRFENVSAKGLSNVSIVPVDDWGGLELKTVRHNGGTMRETLRDAGSSPTAALNLGLDIAPHGSREITLVVAPLTSGVWTEKLYPTSNGERIKTPMGTDYMIITTLRVKSAD